MIFCHCDLFRSASSSSLSILQGAGSTSVSGICHAHLKRDFEKMVSLGGVSKSIGKWGLAEEVRIFDLWEHFREGADLPR